METVALVLAGGVGSRLYPASRGDRPKQFLALGGEEPLLARTVDRLAFADRVVVATRERFADDVADHLAEHIPEVDSEVLIEPAGKDTGPALTYATHSIRETSEGESVVVAAPSDHHVPEEDVEEFRETIRTAARVAGETGRLVTVGVEPTRPEPGYGYIEPGADRGDYREVRRFVEKPDRETAEEYVAAGYYWNAGIFAWTPDAFLAAARDSPLEPLVDALEAGDPAAGFDAVAPESVDHAVMERADDVAVVPAGFDWDDLGAWDALARILAVDADGNAVLGEALTLDAADNVVASDGTHVSLVGVDGLAVVAWDDRVLVVPKEEAQRVREVVDRLKEAGLF